MRSLSWSDSKTIGLLKSTLHNGGVILAKGDTVLGLLADLSEKGRTELDHIKSRSKKPYLLLVGDNKKALNRIETDKYNIFQIEKLMNICWPGPVTFIFHAKSGLVPYSKSIEDTVALRIPDHAGLLQLLEDLDGLFSTSANQAGEPVPSTIEDLDSAIMESVAGVVFDDVYQKPPLSLPSTIIDCTGERMVIVREGAFDINKLANMMDTKLLS